MAPRFLFFYTEVDCLNPVPLSPVAFNRNVARRLALFAASLLVLVSGFSGFNWLRFSPEQWLSAHLPPNTLVSIHAQADQQRMGTALSWQQLQVEWDDRFFTAERVELNFNLLSVLLGKPRAESLSFSSPLLSLPQQPVDTALLRLLIALGAHQLTITNGAIANGQHEVQHLELSMIRNGAFGEYAVQASGQIDSGPLSARLNYSLLMGLDGQDRLVLGKNQFDGQINIENWSARLAGKIKSLIIAADGDLEFSFINWSSAWQNTSVADPIKLDWAGGISAGTWAQEQLQVAKFDSAIAYVDDQDIGHTLAVQSNEARLKDGQVVGQVGLSLLANFPAGSPWQSYNLVMTGTVEEGAALLDWRDPQVLLATIAANQEQNSHLLTMRRLSIDRAAGRWLFDDGDWTAQRAERIIGDYGFGRLAGNWPSLEITEAPTIAAQLQPPLTLIASDVEYLNALFNRLVP